jgi:hypothetical protein
MQDVPPLLAPLVEDRPTAQLKLLAAWDGLSVESQITILRALRGRDPRFSHNAITRDLALKALGSPNAYVRYMVATGVEHALLDQNVDEGTKREGSNGTDSHDCSARTLRELIAADPDPLVRNALLEREGCRDGDLDEFFQQPLVARLARLQGVWDVGDFARIVRHALSRGLVAENELVAMVKEWVSQQDLRRLTETSLYDPFCWYWDWKDFHTLWELVPDLPQAAARILVAKLPARQDHGGIPEEVPEEVLDRMSPALLRVLFDRPDADQEDYRRKVALTHPLENGGRFLVQAAVSRAFDLTHDEFERLMESDVERLAKMHWARHLSPVLLQAAADFFRGKFKTKPPSRLLRGDLALEFEATLDHRLRSLDGWGPKRWLRPRRIWELRVYALAKYLAPPSDDDFDRGYAESLLERDKWLREYVVPGDIWATYVNLRAAAWGETGETLFGNSRRDLRKLRVAKSELAKWKMAQVEKWERVLPEPTSVRNARLAARARATAHARIHRTLRRLDERLDRRLAVLEGLSTRVAVVERVATGARTLFLVACLMYWLGGQSWPAAVSNAVLVYFAWIGGRGLLAGLSVAFLRLKVSVLSAGERLAGTFRKWRAASPERRARARANAVNR